MSIIINNLKKKYGKIEALKGITLTIPHGMYGLLGENGAGKSTLLRILATLITKTSGEIIMNEKSIENSKYIRKEIGYLPQNFSVYPEMTVVQVMTYFDMLSEMPLQGRKSKIDDLLKAVNLEAHKKKKVKTLSGGMKQRLGIALALLNNPKILIIDEPTAGLDPEERIRLRNMLVTLAEDKIVILSTHIVDDIAATCERVGVLHDGKLLFDGRVQELEAVAEGKVFTKKIDYLNEVPIDAFIINKNQEMVRFLSDSLPDGKFEECLPNLEDGYMQLLRKRRKDYELI